VVVMLVVVELQAQLLTWEKELDSWEGAIIAWEDGLTTSEHALCRACREQAQTEAVLLHYLARSRALTSSSKHSINLNRILEEHEILLSLQKMDLKMWQAKLVVEQAHDLHCFNERDLSVEL
jgi:hypothetical protein